MCGTIGTRIRRDGKLLNVLAFDIIQGEPADLGWTKRH
jgi:hypothetical protein